MGNFTPEQIAITEQALKAKVDDHLKSKIKAYSRASNWASDLGFECDTYQVLSRLKAELKPLPSLNLKKLFRASGEWETPNLILMQQAGLRITEQQRPFAWDAKEIHGTIDAMIDPKRSGIDVGASVKRMPLEHKALSSINFQRVLKLHDEHKSLTQAEASYLKKYPAQLMIYDLFDNIDVGSWFFFDKVTGDYFFWIEELDFGYAEGLVQRAERTNAAVSMKVIPAPTRMKICEDCDFRNTFCFVGKDFGPGADLWFDREDVNMKVKRMLETETIADEHDEIEEEMKTLFRGRHVLLPDFEVESEEYEMTIYQVPMEEKKKYAKKIPAFRTKFRPLTKTAGVASPDPGNLFPSSEVSPGATEKKTKKKRS